MAGRQDRCRRPARPSSLRVVPSWQDVQAAAPDLAGRVEQQFEATLHKVMATLRADGSPRVSGTEAKFRNGDLWLGSMLEAMKARDLQRDPRVALHSAPVDPEMRGGDAKIAGRAIEVVEADVIASFADDQEAEIGPYHLFRIDVTEIVLTTVDQERQLLIVESWNTARGLRRTERA